MGGERIYCQEALYCFWIRACILGFVVASETTDQLSQKGPFPPLSSLQMDRSKGLGWSYVLLCKECREPYRGAMPLGRSLTVAKELDIGQGQGNGLLGRNLTLR